MIGLLQRVTEAQVVVGEESVGAIGRGLLVLIGVERADREATAERLLERVLSYRVFPDAEGRMNLSLRDVGGGLLIVPQFTLAADTQKGTRANFASAAPPEMAERLFAYLVHRASACHPETACGRFGADMKVALVNDGPVTFWLRASDPQAGKDRVATGEILA